jgi:hypothetical protein
VEIAGSDLGGVRVYWVKDNLTASTASNSDVGTGM